MGSPPDCMGNENHMKAKNGTMEYGLRTLRVFMNLVESGNPVLGGRPTVWGSGTMADLA